MILTTEDTENFILFIHNPPPYENTENTEPTQFHPGIFTTENTERLIVLKKKKTQRTQRTIKNDFGLRINDWYRYS